MFCDHQYQLYCIRCLPLHKSCLRLKHQHAARVCLHYHGFIQQTICISVVICQVTNTYFTYICSACGVYLPLVCGATGPLRLLVHVRAVSREGTFVARLQLLP